METMEFEVPGDDHRPAMVVRALKPAHPCDEMCVLFDGDTIDHIVTYIKRGGELDADALLNKRTYKRHEPTLEPLADEIARQAPPCVEDIDDMLAEPSMEGSG